jgi:hypothetical protein
MYTLGLITTNHSKRFETLSKTIHSFNKQELRKIPKILSVDQLPGISTNHSFFDKFEKKGWEVIYKNHTGRNSMVTNQLNLLSKVKTEWLLYCEDDVTLRDIPDQLTANKILSNDTGFISLNAHVHEFPSNNVIEYCKQKNNYVSVDRFTLLKKNSDIFQHKWYFNFPSCFVRKEHLQFLLQNASLNYGGSSYSIEEGLSYSWLMHKEKHYNSYIILQNPNLKSEELLQEIHNAAILNYWNNDPSTRIEPVNSKASMWF